MPAARHRQQVAVPHRDRAAHDLRRGRLHQHPWQARGALQLRRWQRLSHQPGCERHAAACLDGTRRRRYRHHRTQSQYPSILVRPKARTGSSFSGSLRARSRRTFGNEVKTGNSTVKYSSRLSLPDFDPFNDRYPLLELHNKAKASATDGSTLTFGVHWTLARGIGPVALFDGKTGRVHATLIAAYVDPDKDGRYGVADNCPKVRNANQLDADRDGAGDACDLDLDDDGVRNGADNCPRLWNADQQDQNNDGKGDACVPPG
ncbi:MAG: thrombospondin type 3 repeat-containing protein [Proteobacteria bacterium]|nr:thrombospondin type 3 repeat-containing protein [Pseudomonadota bacterium]